MGNYTDLNEDADIWMLRCSHYGADAWKMLGYNYDTKEFSDKECYISVGCESGKWSKEDYNSILKSSDKWEEFEKWYKDGKKPRNRYSLYKFFFEFKAGDYIVVPSGREFHIYQIENDQILTYEDEVILNRFKEIGLNYEKIKNQQHDFKFFRKLKLIKAGISRYKYADKNLTAKLKDFSTCRSLNAVKSSVVRGYKSACDNTPLSLYNEAIDDMIKSMMDAVDKITTPDKLEKLVRWYLKKVGADYVVIPAKNDRAKPENADADVIAHFYGLKIAIYVQVKKHDGRTELEKARTQIRNYIEKFELADTGYNCIPWVVCTSKKEEISQEDFEDERIRIIAGEEFAEMLINAGLQDIDSAFE